jgi:hypothetical protein
VRRALRLFLAAACAVATLPAGAAADSPAQGTQGLQAGWAVGDSGVVSFPHSVLAELPIMTEAQAGWVRINFRLGGCYQDWTSPVTAADVSNRGCDPSLVGHTALQAYDQVIDTARADHLQVLGTLSNEAWQGNQDDWTANNAETTSGNGDNAYAQAFASQAAGVLASHFAGRVSRWEVWNEPNAWTDYDDAGHVWGSSWIYPSNFAWLLKRSYAAIKQADSNAIVVAGGLLSTDAGGTVMEVPGPGAPKQIRKNATVPTWQRTPNSTSKNTSCISNVPSSGAGYLCDTYAAGLASAGWITPYPFDVVGQHLYIDQGSTTTTNHVTANLQDVRQAYLAYEGTGTAKQTELTEFGWMADPSAPTYQADAARQAQNLQTIYTVIHATRYVSCGYWFAAQDVPEGSVFYGLVQGGYVAGATDAANLALRKPAFTAYQRYAR